MQILIVGSKKNMSVNADLTVCSIPDLSCFEEAKKTLDQDEPCLFYANRNRVIENHEEVWKFHKACKFAVINILLGQKEEMCSFIPRNTFYQGGETLSYTGIPFTIRNKRMTLDFPEKKIFSVITCIADKNKYHNILLPSLHRANNFLLDNNLSFMETICVNGSDFKTIGAAYNYGISQSHSDIKIFVHEDLDLMDPSWVLKILLGFSDPTVGLLGLVGSTSPSYTDHWWMSGVKYVYGKQYVGVGAKKELWHWNWPLIPATGKLGMLLVDGCFMATNRDITFEEFEGNKFFLTPYEHEIGNKIINMNLKIGIIKHLTWHYAYPKEDTSKIASKDDFLNMIKTI